VVTVSGAVVAVDLLVGLHKKNGPYPVSFSVL